MNNYLPDSEKALDAYIRKEIAKANGLYIKLGTTIFSGLPDRLILLPFGKVVFAELKSKGKIPTKLQASIHKKIRELGFTVLVVTGGEHKDVLYDIYL